LCLGYTFWFVRGPRSPAGARRTGFRVCFTNPKEKRLQPILIGVRAALGASHNKEINVNKMFLTAALAAASLAGAASLAAQSAPAVGSATTAKVGVLNVRQAIIATAEGKQASNELQGQFAARQTDLENLNKQINDIRQRLQANGDKLSPEEGARLQRQGESL